MTRVQHTQFVHDCARHQHAHLGAQLGAQLNVGILGLVLALRSSLRHGFRRVDHGRCRFQEASSPCGLAIFGVGNGYPSNLYL